MLIPGEHLYRIGSTWIFDANSCVGYQVLFGADDIVFEEAFQIAGNSEDVKYYMEVPIGIVRRAFHIIKLKQDGLLGICSKG